VLCVTVVLPEAPGPGRGLRCLAPLRSCSPWPRANSRRPGGVEGGDRALTGSGQCKAGLAFFSLLKPCRWAEEAGWLGQLPEGHFRRVAASSWAERVRASGEEPVN
jgi:hypothetical protein